MPTLRAVQIFVLLVVSYLIFGSVALYCQFPEYLTLITYSGMLTSWAVTIWMVQVKLVAPDRLQHCTTVIILVLLLGTVSSCHFYFYLMVVLEPEALAHDWRELIHGDRDLFNDHL